MSTKVIDEGDLRHYRHEIPNLVDDMELSPFAYRLYGHLKRRAGDSGQCDEGVRSMAKHCQMSPASIVNAKKELVSRGLITIKDGDKTKSIPDTIFIVNIWRQNLQTFKKRPPVHLMNTPCSPNEHPVHEQPAPCSLGEHPVHDVAQKKEPTEEGTGKKEITEVGKTARDVFENEAVKLYVEVMRPEPGLPIHRAEVIAGAVTDLGVWRETLEVYAGNGYRGQDGTGRNAGNAIHRYREELERRKAEQRNGSNQKNTATRRRADSEPRSADGAVSGRAAYDPFADKPVI